MLKVFTDAASTQVQRYELRYTITREQLRNAEAAALSCYSGVTKKNCE